jgi:folate-binding protein YgfZ
MEEARVDAPVDRETSVALAGPAAPLLVAGLIGESAVAPWIARERVLVRDCPCRLYGDARRGASLFHVTMESDDRDSVVEELLDRCRARGGGRAGAAAWDFHRIESGLTRHGIDTDAETVPLDAALNGAVDFKKGCFPGQETLAKIRNLGHPARVLVRLNVEGDVEIERGAAILGEDTEEPIGEATSSRSIPSLGRTAALGFLKWRFRDVARAKIVTREGDPAQAELERVG